MCNKNNKKMAFLLVPSRVRHGKKAFSKQKCTRDGRVVNGDNVRAREQRVVARGGRVTVLSGKLSNNRVIINF